MSLPGQTASLDENNVTRSRGEAVEDDPPRDRVRINIQYPLPPPAEHALTDRLPNLGRPGVQPSDR